MKIALIGYGKMGRMIERTALQRGHEIVARIDIDNHSDIFTPAFASADVAIEFTSPASAYANCLDAMRQGVKVVSGSTGWNDRLPELKAICDRGEGTLMQSSNFSIGMNLFMMLSRTLTRLMVPFAQYSPTLTETHHVHKLDHPSGTAITLAEGIMEEDPRVKGWTETTLTAPDGTLTTLAQAAPGFLPVATVRRGEVPGIHTVTWDSEADEISITHSAHSRAGFALGAVLAAEWLASRSGWHTMPEMMKSLIS